MRVRVRVRVGVRLRLRLRVGVRLRLRLRLWLRLRLKLRLRVRAEVADAIAGNAEALRRFPASARLFLPGDRPPAAGTTLANTALAATLRAVAARPDALSQGELAAQLAAEIAAAGGSVTAGDLAQYAPVLRAPLRLDVGGVALLGVPPPSSGGAHRLGPLTTLP